MELVEPTICHVCDICHNSSWPVVETLLNILNLHFGPQSLGAYECLFSGQETEILEADLMQYQSFDVAGAKRYHRLRYLTNSLALVEDMMGIRNLHKSTRANFVCRPPLPQNLPILLFKSLLLGKGGKNRKIRLSTFVRFGD